MKILHIISHFSLGGAERVALNIAKGNTDDCQQQIFEVVRSSGEFTNAFLKEMDENNIAHYSSSHCNTKSAIFYAALRLLVVCLREKPTVIHTHTEVPDLTVWLFYKLFGWWLFPRMRYVRTIHNTQLWNDWKQIGRIVEPFFQRNTLVAIGKNVQKAYKDNYGCEPQIVYNGLEELHQKRFEFLREGKINVIVCGRQEPQKGTSVMTTVVKKLLATDNRYFFHIIGNGSEGHIVRKELQDQENVRIYDSVYGLAAYFGSFDCLFMPSLFEGLGLASIEASLAGCPPIINDTSGLSETLPENWPLKVQNNCIDSYLHIFRDIFPVADRSVLSATAAAYANEHFTARKMQEAYMLLYYHTSPQ